VGDGLLERDAELGALLAAVADAAAGRGCAVLVTGEAGIGKTSVIRAFVAALGDDAGALVGSCDDLLAAPSLGPLRDAARASGGPLEKVLAADGTVEAVFGALIDESYLHRPAVLIVEDIHWADDATLDVLGYLVRRLREVAIVVVMSAREEAIHTGHRLRQLLAAFAASPVRRLALRPLSEHAVIALSSGSGREPTELYALTHGNPFYVTELLSAPLDEVPATVTDAVLARLHGLSPASVSALEQLCVIPALVDFELAERVLGDRMDALAAAERSGMVEARRGGVAFRHELARRAIEQNLSAVDRRSYNRAVVRALVRADRPDAARLVHHAMEAGDADSVAAYAPRSGRAAAAAGSHRQALVLYEAALHFADRLSHEERARVLDDYGWELYNAARFDDAVAAGQEAVERYQRLGDDVALGEALVRLSRHVFMTGQTDAAEQAVGRAVQVLERTGTASALALALAYQGAVLALSDRAEEAVHTLDRARRLAIDVSRADLVALCLNYLGVARSDLTGPSGMQDLRDSLSLSTRSSYHEYAARAYTNLAELLYRFGSLDELAALLDEALAFTDERGFWSHAYNLRVHRCLLDIRRGEWQGAARVLREMVETVDNPGMLYVYSVPPHARLLARRGAPEAELLLRQAWHRAVTQKSLLGIAHSGIALVEWAWLVGRSDAIDDVAQTVLARTSLPGAAPLRAELLRYLVRSGGAGGAFDGCPEPYAAGLRGDWRAAAAAWARVGDPYEQALELAESGEVAPTLDALRRLDELGASAAAAIVRQRLRVLGVRNVPRGPLAVTRANPAGLTNRQLGVLSLIARGHTNAEIAEQLVLSVRTVDHHVSAILSKLGAQSRRDAVAIAAALGAGGSPTSPETS
jgi:DNA-binding CsgD family transcriptional regulator/tetratricopeptide (TPR) repeat protein